MPGRIAVVEQDESGRNTVFKDTRTGKRMSRAQLVRAIEAGGYPTYHVRKINGLKTPVSNPDSKPGNNLG